MEVWDKHGKVLFSSLTYFDETQYRSVGDRLIGGNGQTTLKTGQMISTTFDGRKYEFKMQYDGNAVLYEDGRAIWNTGTSGPTRDDYTITMHGGDGNLLLRQGWGEGEVHKWQSGTNNTKAASAQGGATIIFKYENKPALIINGSAGEAIVAYNNDWPGGHKIIKAKSVASSPVVKYDSIGDRMLSGGELRTGQMISTTFDGKTLEFRMQYDGNAVLYENGNAIWATGTNKGEAQDYSIRMKQDGYLVVYKGAEILWHSGTGVDPNTSTTGDRPASAQGGAAIMFKYQETPALIINSASGEAIVAYNN